MINDGIPDPEERLSSHMRSSDGKGELVDLPRRCGSALQAKLTALAVTFMVRGDVAARSTSDDSTLCATDFPVTSRRW